MGNDKIRGIKVTPVEDHELVIKYKAESWNTVAYSIPREEISKDLENVAEPI